MRPTVSLLGIASLVLSLAPGLHALDQEGPPPERVIHLWVDPMYGNDSSSAATPGAGFLNPNGSLACGINPALPNDVADPSQAGAVLLHAPWAFKTITAAVAYLVAQSPVSPPLPYTSPTTGVIAAHAIIHLLPGNYARSTMANPDNGLPGNGETFPIHLPPNVSIQGTSALNTVINLEGVGPAFEFGLIAGGIPINGENTFIDSLSIFNATRDEMDPSTSAAIVLQPDLPSHPTISNCFLFKNRVGVLVAASRDGTAAHDGTLFINNTFVWNRIGLWNGQLPDRSLPATGISNLILINNIFDSSNPGIACRSPQSWPSVLPGFSNFEGVSTEDMTVAGPPAVNFNAFEYAAGTIARYNYGQTITFGLPATAPRTTTALFPAASRNIAPYTGWSPNPIGRGTLYIRDALCNGPFQPNNLDWDQSPMDFRLCPAVAPPNETPGGSSGALNPLVDNGFSGPFPVLMANGLTQMSEPGFLPLGTSQSTWPHTAWEFDGEGYGNPRLHDHPRYATAFVADIGADELGEHIVAGYRFGTTSFLDLDDNSPVAIMDNKYLYYFGPPTTLAGTPTLPFIPNRREYSVSQTLPTNYTGAYGSTGHPWVDTWSFSPSAPYYGATNVDITPHLVGDIHPVWQILPFGWPSFPVWQHCFGGGNYNQALYWNPVAGVANPPGTYFGITLPATYDWIDEAGLTDPVNFAPVGPFGGPSALANFDVWCRGNDGAMPPKNVTTLPPTFTGTSLVGVRVSGETPFPTFSAPSPGGINVQSYVVIVESPPSE